MGNIVHIHKFFGASGKITMDRLGHSYTVTQWTDGYPEITTRLTKLEAEKLVADYLKADVLETN